MQQTPEQTQQILTEPERVLPDFTFDQLPAAMREALQSLGWTAPMPVQAKSIPYLLDNRDMIVQSRTGSGKTGAFMMPLLMRIDPERRHPQALVLVPTRELAMQVHREFEILTTGMDVRGALLYGGVGYNQQLQWLREGAQVIIGTPGRVLDHIGRRTLNLDRLNILVFDEADEMLSMGFYPDMRELRRYLPRERSSWMFSATMPYKVQMLAREFLREPEFLTLSAGNVAVSTAEHRFYDVPPLEKDLMLMRLIEFENPESAIIFCNMKVDVEYLTTVLRNYGYNVDQLSGDLDQKSREKAMARIKRGETRFLVATDVAARGIDISDLSHVFQYDVPKDPDSYIHRAGRTARAGNTGVVITLVANISEKSDLKKIARKYNVEFVELPMPTTEEVEQRIGERVTVLLEDRLRTGITRIERQRMKRFGSVVQNLAESEEERMLLAMLLDEIYHNTYHRPAPSEPEPEYQSQSGSQGGSQSGSQSGGQGGRSPQPERQSQGGSQSAPQQASQPRDEEQEIPQGEGEERRKKKRRKKKRNRNRGEGEGGMQQGMQEGEAAPESASGQERPRDEDRPRDERPRDEERGRGDERGRPDDRRRDERRGDERRDDRREERRGDDRRDERRGDEREQGRSQERGADRPQERGAERSQERGAPREDRPREERPREERGERSQAPREGGRDRGRDRDRDRGGKDRVRKIEVAPEDRQWFDSIEVIEPELFEEPEGSTKPVPGEPARGGRRDEPKGGRDSRRERGAENAPAPEPAQEPASEVETPSTEAAPEPAPKRATRGEKQAAVAAAPAETEAEETPAKQKRAKKSAEPEPEPAPEKPKRRGKAEAAPAEESATKGDSAKEASAKPKRATKSASPAEAASEGASAKGDSAKEASAKPKRATKSAAPESAEEPAPARGRAKKSAADAPEAAPAKRRGKKSEE